MNRSEILFPPQHAALREDVHALGALVGEILCEQGGADAARHWSSRIASAPSAAAMAIRRPESSSLRALQGPTTGGGARSGARIIAWFQVVNSPKRCIASGGAASTF